MSVREVDELEWWQRRMYLEEWGEEIRRQNAAYDETDGDDAHQAEETYGSGAASHRRGYEGYGGAVPGLPPGMSPAQVPGFPGTTKSKDSLQGMSEMFGVTTRKIPA